MGVSLVIGIIVSLIVLLTVVLGTHYIETSTPEERKDMAILIPRDRDKMELGYMKEDLDYIRKTSQQ